MYTHDTRIPKSALRHLVGDAGDPEKGITSHYMYNDDV